MRLIRLIIGIAPVFLKSLVFMSAGSAQAVFGSVHGSITDLSEAGVSNAQVVLTEQNKNTRFEVTADANGAFQRSQLIPGVYTVEVTAAGFQRSILRDVAVNVDTATRTDIGLSVGEVTTQVEVTSEAPLLKMDRADVAVTFSSKQLTELPSLGRNFRSYLLLTPGTQRLSWQHASSENPQGSVQIQVNGQHFSGTGYQLDGTDNQDPILGIIVINPTLESVTETKIISQNYDAEFGLAISGIVNTSTKSGSNEFHGSAFDYIQNNTPGNTTFARNPFNAAENDEVPPLEIQYLWRFAGWADHSR